MISRVARLALFLALVASALSAARAAVIGVDLGGEYLKVSLVAPGRTPIAITLNEVSKRKTTAAVSFVNGERAVGEPANDMMPRSPGDVATRARDALVSAVRAHVASTPGETSSASPSPRPQFVSDSSSACVLASLNCAGDNRDTNYIRSISFTLS